MYDRKNLSIALMSVFSGILLCIAVTDLAIKRACPYDPCIDNSQVIPLSDRDYFPAVHQRLGSAKESIHIASFEVKYYAGYPKSNQNILVEDLINASMRGVDVFVIVDEYSTENNAFDYLRANGVNVRYDSEDVTTHAKLIIVDGRTTVLGSTNLSYFGLEKNNEANVLIHAYHVAEYFEDYFWNLWDS